MELPPLYALAFAVGTTLVLLAIFRIGQHFATPEKTVAKAFADKNAARHLLHVGEVLGIFMVAPGLGALEAVTYVATALSIARLV